MTTPQTMMLGLFVPLGIGGEAGNFRSTLGRKRFCPGLSARRLHVSHHIKIAPGTFHWGDYGSLLEGSQTISQIIYSVGEDVGGVGFIQDTP
jgi:hypothetical protein